MQCKKTKKTSFCLQNHEPPLISGEENDEHNIIRKTIPSFVPVTLFWLFILCSPLLMLADVDSRSLSLDWRDIARIYASLLFSVFIFAMNQAILIPRYFIQKKIVKYILLNFLLILFFFLLRELVFRFILFSLHGCFFSAFTHEGNPDLKGGLKFVVAFILFTLLSCLMNILIRLSAHQTKRAFAIRARENAFLKSELSFLKLQLSPHFLFNTLNNIAALIDLDTSKARIAVLQLSKMLRTILYDVNQDSITIKEETEILEKFLYLEQLRFNENVECTMDIRIEDDSKRIAPLLLMPLVENAVKHGINPRQKSFIRIRIEEKDGILLFRSENSNFPRIPRDGDKTGGGLGLSNTLKRLDTFYGEHYEYGAYVENGVYYTTLKINLSISLSAFES